MGLEERLVKAMGLDGLSPEGNALMQELQQLLDSLVYKPDMRFTNLIDAPRQREYGNAHGFPVKVDFQNDEVVFADPDSYDPYEEEAAAAGPELKFHGFHTKYFYMAHDTYYDVLTNGNGLVLNGEIYDPDGMVTNHSGTYAINFQEDGLYRVRLYFGLAYEINSDASAPVYLDAQYYFDQTDGFDDFTTTDTGPGPGYLLGIPGTTAFRNQALTYDTGDSVYNYPAGGLVLEHEFSVSAGDYFYTKQKYWTSGYAGDGSPQAWFHNDFVIYRIGDKVTYT